MKFYNPFKWHIVQIVDKYYARKYVLFDGWVFHDNKREITWSRADYALKHGCFDSIEAACNHVLEIERQSKAERENNIVKFVKML